MPPQRRRLDAELVRRKIARSREQAVEMIKAGRVTVGGFKAMKPATVVEPEVSIKVEASEGDDWASRGAHKLLGALEAFDVDLRGKRVLDAGASTGGFTDVCLRRDLSFISLKLVLPAIASCMADGAWLLPMVKPQFEVGKDRIGSGGVVRSPELRAEVTKDVAIFAQGLGLSVKGVAASPLPGPSGNVEYFLWLVKDGLSTPEDRLDAMIETAIKEGPQ